MSSTDRLLTIHPPDNNPIKLLNPLRWAAAGIRTKILAPLIILMLLSLLGSTVGFIVSTNTTRNRILDGQIEQEGQRMVVALKQSEDDITEGARILSQDPQIVEALQKDKPGSDVVMSMDSRAVTVQTRFHLDQIIIQNSQQATRVNIAAHSDLSELHFFDHQSLSACTQDAHIDLINVSTKTLLVGCAPILTTTGQGATIRQEYLGTIYTVQDVTRALTRFKRELGLSAQVQLIDNNMLTSQLAQDEHMPMESGVSLEGYRIQNLTMKLATMPINISLKLREQEINEIVGAGLNVMLVSSGITLVLLLSIGIWVAQGITRPILKLDQVAQAVAAGDLTRRTNLYHQDEIGRLGRSFDHATATISHLLDQLERTAGERHAILQSMADGLLAVDRDQRIIIVNPVAASLLGQKSSALISKPLNTLTMVDDPILCTGLQQVVDQVRSELTDPEHKQVEEHITLGDRVVRLHSSPTLGSGNKLTGAVVVLQDITKAVEADRAKSAFIGTASHELRTPLASMKGFVDIFYMSGTENLTESQRMFLDTIKRQTENLVQLVNDLLEMARLEQGISRGEQQWVTLPTVLDESLHTLKPHIEKREAHIHVDMVPNLPTIWIDPLHIRRILTNLISNAVKYIHQGGNVHIRMHIIEDPALLPSSPGEQIWKFQEQKSIVLEVEDNGVGIRESDHAKIFTRFFRSDNDLSVEAGGSGLGLAITQSLVHLHHGQIGFRSVEKEGSCFWIRLPISNTEMLDSEEYMNVTETEEWSVQ